jgi:hypothetical protein
MPVKDFKYVMQLTEPLLDAVQMYIDYVRDTVTKYSRQKI